MSKILTWIFSGVIMLTASLSAGGATPVSGKPYAKAVASRASATLAKPSEPEVSVKTRTKGQARVKPRTTGAASTGRLKSPAGNVMKSGRKAAKAAPADDATLPTLWGSVVYADDWNPDSAPFGLYSVPMSGASEFQLLQLGPDATYGGTLVDETYYWCEVEAEGSKIIAIHYFGMDVNSGELVYHQTGDCYSVGMTFDHTTGQVYAIVVIGRENHLATLSFVNGFSYTDLGAFKGDFDPDLNEWNALACGKDGQLYGITYDYDEDLSLVGCSLCRIDKTDATVTKVGDTGVISEFMSGMVADPVSGRMFWSVSDYVAGYLCEVDLNTGAATDIYDFPLNNQVVGMAIPGPKSEDGAPAAVQNATAEFLNGSLSGMVSFTAPSTLFDGTPATGALTYTVTANGLEVATGATSYGAPVSVELTMPEAGLYTFEITVANKAGMMSPAAKIHNVYVGNDTPEATKATLVYEDGNMNLTWLPVTAAINGGYLDADAITYTVVRHAGQDEGVTVASGIKVTSFSEPISEPESMTRFHYDVTVECNGMTSAAARSNTVTIGAIVPPYTADFLNDFSDFTVIDGNGDGNAWELQPDGKVRVVYNKSVAMDDWLITPPIRLEGKVMYDVAASISANLGSYPEKMEIMSGKEPTAQAMTTTLMEPTVLTAPKNTPLEWSHVLIPEETGNYYIGFHGISDPDSFYLWVHSFSISKGGSALVPVAGQLTVTPGVSGARTAAVKFIVPDKAMDGSALTAITKAELSRDGQVIKTWENPVPGAELTFDDTLAQSGEYKYAVVCSNAAGEGAIASATVFVGVNLPAAVSNLYWTETANPGEVTISWDAVTNDISGNALDPSQVKYQVYTVNGIGERVALTDQITNTSYTYQAVPEGKQEFLQYAVFAYTESGEGEGAISNFDPSGTPYHEMTFSCYDDFDKYALSTSDEGGASWGVYNDSMLPGVTSCDGDDFFFGMYSQYLYRYADIMTGYIDLEGMENPSVSFYIYNAELYQGAPNINDVAVSVRVKGQREWTEIKKAVANQSAPLDGWGKVIAGLAEYAGKTIQVKFTGTANAGAYTYIDCLRVGTQLNRDLSLSLINAPAKVALGEEYTVTATVLNEGSDEANAYSVELYADDVLVDTKDCSALASGASVKVELKNVMSALATEPVSCFAKIVYAADQNVDNNQSDNVTIAPDAPAYPVVNDLAGSVNGDAVVLTWSAPDLSKAPGEAITQDFEDGDAFANTYGNWTFADQDGDPVGGFSQLEIPNIVSWETTGSFWVWDASVAGNATFAAHSGTKYLFSLYTGMMTDDWAISPELDGSAQTVSFYARSYSSDFEEEIQVLYSEGSIEPDDFIQVEGVGGLVPHDWTLYKVELPAGAKHFAIRSHSIDKMMLMVDDVTYIPAGAAHNLEIKGYNVYRDGVKLNEAVVEGTSYTDANVEDGKTYTYKVTVDYNKGESAASNSAEVRYESSAVNAVGAGVAKIGVAGRSIVVTGAEGSDIMVYTADGKLVNAVRGEAKTVIPAAQGVYVVKTGDTVAKVVVK